MNTLQTFEGDLYVYDNPEKPLSGRLLRKNYSRHHRAIDSVADLKATLREGSSTALGGYPLYLVTSDGATICFDCGRSEFHNIAGSIRHHYGDGWRVESCVVNYEETDLRCNHCGEPIPSACGDD